MDLKPVYHRAENNLHDGLRLVKLHSVRKGFVNFRALTLSRATPRWVSAIDLFRDFAKLAGVLSRVQGTSVACPEHMETGEMIRVQQV
jgi:hypothetical protein